MAKRLRTTMSVSEVELHIRNNATNEIEVKDDFIPTKRINLLYSGKIGFGLNFDLIYLRVKSVKTCAIDAPLLELPYTFEKPKEPHIKRRVSIQQVEYTCYDPETRSLTDGVTDRFIEGAQTPTPPHIVIGSEVITVERPYIYITLLDILAFHLRKEKEAQEANDN